VNGWVVFAAGIQKDTTEEQTKDYFDRYGCVKKIMMPSDKITGSSKGYALIEYSTQEEGEAAISQSTISPLLGPTLNVSWAFCRSSRVDTLPGRRLDA